MLQPSRQKLRAPSLPLSLSLTQTTTPAPASSPPAAPPRRAALRRRRRVRARTRPPRPPRRRRLPRQRPRRGSYGGGVVGWWAVEGGQWRASFQPALPSPLSHRAAAAAASSADASRRLATADAAAAASTSRSSASPWREAGGGEGGGRVAWRPSPPLCSSLSLVLSLSLPHHVGAERVERLRLRRRRAVSWRRRHVGRLRALAVRHRGAAVGAGATSRGLTRPRARESGVWPPPRRRQSLPPRALPTALSHHARPRRWQSQGMVIACAPAANRARRAGRRPRALPAPSLQPLKKPKAAGKDLDDEDKAFLQKKKEVRETGAARAGRCRRRTKAPTALPRPPLSGSRRAQGAQRKGGRQGRLCQGQGVQVRARERAG